ncbi:hypothetical protein BDQ17DRAFT_1429558 [Cyathus striatus]|nr:hypothetical protein BDQ17DRAFT_1429558 [Cyathus striatus]
MGGNAFYIRPQQPPSQHLLHQPSASSLAANIVPPALSSSLLAATILTSTQQSAPFSPSIWHMSPPSLSFCVCMHAGLIHNEPPTSKGHNGDSDNNNNNDNDVEEEIEEMIIDEKNTSLTQVEEEDVES